MCIEQRSRVFAKVDPRNFRDYPSRYARRARVLKPPFWHLIRIWKCKCMYNSKKKIDCMPVERIVMKLT